MTRRDCLSRIGHIEKKSHFLCSDIVTRMSSRRFNKMACSVVDRDFFSTFLSTLVVVCSTKILEDEEHWIKAHQRFQIRYVLHQQIPILCLHEFHCHILPTRFSSILLDIYVDNNKVRRRHISTWDCITKRWKRCIITGFAPKSAFIWKFLAFLLNLCDEQLPI